VSTARRAVLQTAGLLLVMGVAGGGCAQPGTLERVTPTPFYESLELFDEVPGWMKEEGCELTRRSYRGAHTNLVAEKTWSWRTHCDERTRLRLFALLAQRVEVAKRAHGVEVHTFESANDPMIRFDLRYRQAGMRGEVRAQTWTDQDDVTVLMLTLREDPEEPILSP
jgi:hypothetical protein